MADVLPADQLQRTLTAAQQDDRTTGSISSSGCVYPLGPACADGPLGVGAFGVGALLAVMAVVILARNAR